MCDTNIFDNIPEDCIFEIPHKNNIISAKIVNVCDGDTFVCLFELKNGVFFQTKIRLCGIDTPESHPKNIKDEELYNLEKRAADHTKLKVKKLIEGKILKIRIKDYDKYGGRYIGDVFLSNAINPRKSSLLANYLIKKGFGKEYYGDKKEEWLKEELLFILES